MYKKTTPKNFKLFLFKTFLAILVLSIPFQFSLAQNPAKMDRNVKQQLQKTEAKTADAFLTSEMVKANMNPSVATQATPTDVPAINKAYAEKIAKIPPPTANMKVNNPVPNLVTDLCTFNGALVPGDPTLDNGRPFRSGIASSCAAPTSCGAPFAGSGFFYDTYTMQNLTCASQCVTVSYIANAGGGDVFVSAFLGSFNPNSLCTNWIADGGSSSLSPGATVTFSFNLAANATVVLVANIAFATPCPSYTMTVSGLTCSPPPPCVPPTSSVLSQVLGPPVPVNLFNEGFEGAIPPAGWAMQNLSLPVGSFPNWFQGGPTGVFPPHTGVGFAASNFQAISVLGTISNWLFAPTVTLKNGDVFSFWTRTTNGVFPDRMQVRMSTNGASVNVGANNTSVGDFTTLLLDINPTYTSTGYPTAWTQFTLTLSGLPAGGVSGRLAFRYFVENGGPPGANSDFIGVDDAAYTTTSAGAPPTTCTGSTTNLKVDMTGGAPGDLYDVTINVVPAAAGYPRTITNYASGSYIAVTPAVTSTYSLVSVIVSGNPCCIGSGNSGTPTVTVLPAAVTPIAIAEDPAGPLCAGSPKLLTIVGAGGVATFSNTNPITINDAAPASPSPANIVVSGLPAAGTTVSNVKILGFSHTWSGDVNIVLQSPTLQNVILKGNSAGGDPFVAATNVNLTFDDAAVGSLPTTSPMASGTYKPTNYNPSPFSFLAPGPAGVVTPVFPASPTLATFTGNMNGTWKLFVEDRVGGDVGNISGGYSITFSSPPAPPPVGWTFIWAPASGLSSTTTNPVAASPLTTTTYTVIGTAPGGCQTSAAVTITVNQLPAVVTNPGNTTACAGSNASFTVAGTGAGITYQWQESANGGVTYTNITNGGIYGGATTATLTLTGVTIGMNNYRYRCVISGTCAPAANSSGAILTVNALPVVTISPAGQSCGGVAGINGLALTASGATSYVWSPLAGLYTNATATTAYTGQNLATVYAAPTLYTVYTVTGTSGATGCSGTASANVNYTPPAPTVTPASVTMCLGDPAVRLTSSSTTSTAVQFCSGTISVPVPDASLTGAISNITVSGIPASCNIASMSVTWNMTHTWDGDMVFALKAPNSNILNLDYFLSSTGGAGATTGFVNTTVSSAGVNALSSGSGTYTGTFKPDAIVGAGPFGPSGPTGYSANVNNFPALYSTPNGTYTLAMYDGGAGDVGTLTSWCINITYVCGVPSTAATWTPSAGLFTDPTALIAYTGTPRDTVYTRPTPSGVYNYQATVQSLSLPPAAPSTPMTGGNGNNTISFNLTNNNPIAMNLTGISSNAFGSGAITARAFYKVGAIAGNPGTINPANGWNQFGPTVNSNVTAGALNPVLTGLSLAIPSGATYGIILEMTGATFPAYTNGTGAPVSYTNGGCTITVDGSVGWGGPATPGPMVNNPRNFNGTVYLSAASGAACTSPARNVVVTVNQPTTVTTQPVNQTICTDKVASFTVVASGTGPFSYQWQVSTDNGNTFTNISNGGVYSGATSATLVITAPPVSLNGNFYRCVIQGAAPCASVPSFTARLTVNPLPTIVISAAPYVRLFPGLVTTLSSTVSPVAAASYTWLRNGVQVAGANTGTLNVNVDGLGDYSLRVTDVNGCTNTSNVVSIKDSVSGRCFIYPNPNSGQFQVRYYSALNNVLPRTLTVYDAKGEQILSKIYTIGRPYDRMDVDMRKNGKGLYWVEIGDMNGNRLTMCRIVIQ